MLKIKFVLRYCRENGNIKLYMDLLYRLIMDFKGKERAEELESKRIKMMKKVVIIGGGAAGMYAGIFAARAGHRVQIFEKNEKLGKKLFITGKGRCNLTNGADMEQLFGAVCRNEKFLYSAFYGHTNDMVMEQFEAFGVPLKTERGERVFPVSDHSSDVISALRRTLEREGVQVHLNTEVKEIRYLDGRVDGIVLADGHEIPADAVIVATGGLSYPSTGSTGDGYRFAKEAGHRIVDCCPSLVPLEIKEAFVRELQGLSLRNVEVRLLENGKEKYRNFGEMLFTHFGVSGPLILSGSAYLVPLQKEKEYTLLLDLKPALSEKQLDERVLRDFNENKNRQFKNALGKLFPSTLIPVMIALSGIHKDKKVNEISKEERERFVRLIKEVPMTITASRGYKEAIITRGGVSVKEINPSSMESKKVKGLYFIGEVLDLDALTGGFNLQIAWSTAYAAATSLAESQ